MVSRYRHRVMVGPPRESVSELKPELDYAELHRKKNSHRGIGEFKHLRKLAAGAVNQEFLDEIGQLTQLTHLDLRWPMRAEDIAPIANLDRLEVLHMDSPTRVEDWSPLYKLRKLRVLTIENPRKMRDIEWVTPLLGQLEVLGIEGSLDTNVSIDGIDPLRRAIFEAFFCTSMTNRSKSLAALHDCPNLKLLDGAVLAPWREYKALREAKPDIVCQWFNPNNWYKGWRDGPSDADREAG